MSAEDALLRAREHAKRVIGSDMTVLQISLRATVSEACLPLFSALLAMEEAGQALLRPPRTQADRDGTMIGWFHSEGPSAMERLSALSAALSTIKALLPELSR